MSSSLDNIVQLKKSQINIAGKTIARAYMNDPLFSYFIPDPLERQKKVQYLFNFQIRYSLSFGEVNTTSSNIEGIAVWLPHDKAEISPWQAIRYGFIFLSLRLGVRIMKKILSYNDFCEEYHKHYANMPHWYLYNVAVDPEHQGKGYASKLLKPFFARMDKLNIPCYLETQIENNISLYKHFGFKVVETATLPNTEFLTTFMLRT